MLLLFKKKKLKLLFILFLIVTIPVGVYLLSKKTAFFGRASGIPANIIVDAGTSYEGKSGVWKNLAQGGEEKNRMLMSVIGEVKSLAPEYIRIDHVFDNYDLISRNSTGEIIFDWTNLDLTLKDILSTGAKPFISISYTPKALNGGIVTDLPYNWIEWENIVQKLVEHISGIKSLAISNVYYEVWNEPDLFGAFKLTGTKNYLDLYLHTAKSAAKAVYVLPFKIGGPATTGFYPNWLTTLINYVVKNNLKLDFYSWHLYTKKIDDFQSNYLSAKKLLQVYPNYSNLELIISESGISGENDSAYDNNLSAILTISAASVAEGNINKIFVFEIKDGPGDKKYWGRWGILTNDKFGLPEKKPRFMALDFLNKMTGKNVNLAGNGSWVKAFAKNDGKALKILVVNFDPTGNHSEAVPIKIMSLKNGNYSLTRSDFLGKTSIVNIIVDSNSWSAVEYFPANSASIFSLVNI